MSFGNVGAEYEVQFALDATGALQPYLYSVTSAGVATLLNGGAPLDTGFSSDGESVELAIPQTLLTPAGGVAPTSISFATLINNGADALPGSFASNPEYTIADPSAAPVPDDHWQPDYPRRLIHGLAGVRHGHDAGKHRHGISDLRRLPERCDARQHLRDRYRRDRLRRTRSSVASTIIYLNTDQNDTTGYSPFGDVGAEFEVQFSLDASGVLQPYLYSVTPTGVTTVLNGGAPLDFGFSSNGESVELAIPQALLTPAGGAAPTSINFDTLINNGAAALPRDFADDPEYTITDPAAVAPAATTIGNADHAGRTVHGLAGGRRRS